MRAAGCHGVRTLAALLAIALLSPPPARAAAQDDDAHLATVRQRDATDEAVTRGVRWLVSQQDPHTGAFRGKLPNTYTGLACMALMAAGHFPGRSEYGEALRRGILFLADEAGRRDGYFGKEGDARMYGHGICALALTEAYGMLEEDVENHRVKLAAEQAIQVILRAQIRDRKSAHFGGWRYEPNGNDADLSVTAWQVLVLRSAENCQLDVPMEAVSNAVDYVRRSFTEQGGGYAYQPGKVTPAMRCAGVVSMRALGAVEDPADLQRATRSASFLHDFDPAQASAHFFYQSYYVATAANMMGDEFRDLVLPRLERHLCSLQSERGEFRNHKGYDGGVYSTAFSIICLSVRYQYLPIYQE